MGKAKKSTFGYVLDNPFMLDFGGQFHGALLSHFGAWKTKFGAPNTIIMYHDTTFFTKLFVKVSEPWWLS